MQFNPFHWYLQQPPIDGWYKLLTAEEGDFYNVPVPEEGTDLVQLKSQMRVSSAINRYLEVLKFANRKICLKM